jgi:hypothetical protein
MYLIWNRLKSGDIAKFLHFKLFPWCVFTNELSFVSRFLYKHMASILKLFTKESIAIEIKEDVSTEPDQSSSHHPILPLQYLP